jgi:hypothetical protein
MAFNPPELPECCSPPELPDRFMAKKLVDMMCVPVERASAIL